MPVAEVEGRGNSRRLRILHCTWAYGRSPFMSGGAERQAQLLAEDLARLGHAVHVVCPRWPGTSGGLLNGVQVHRLFVLNRRPFRTLCYAAALAAFLAFKIRQFDVVHVHLAFVHSDVVCFIARVAGVPVWVKVAASGPLGELQRARRFAWLTRWIGVRWAARVQALSPEIATELRAVGVEASRIVALPNAVDTGRFTPATPTEKSALRERLDLPQDSVTFLFVGRLARHKGLPELLQAWQRLRLHKASLVLVGSDYTMDPVGTVAGDRSVLVRSWSDRTEDYYRAADLFVLPSHVEGMSNALLEALACGLPAIASEVGAATELIRPEINGLLVKPGSVAELEVAVDKLYSDSDLRRRLGTAARDSSLRYSIDSVAPRLLAQYEEMVHPKC